MKVLVLGASGFAGSALCRALSERGHDVFDADMANCRYLFNLADTESIDSLMQKSSPDAIVHLAGASSVGESWKNPAKCFELNVNGAVSVYSSFLKYAPNARFIFAGSAEEYGRSTDTSFKESDICTPSNPYALSKFTAAEAMQMLADKNAANFIHLRLANHFGPNQRKGFVTADFSLQIAERMLNGDTSDISVGNLEAMRDFLYIDDVIDAYIKIIEAPHAATGTYNIGSGSPIQIKDILTGLLEISSCQAKITVDPEKFRSADIKRMSLDISKISEELNWRPRISLKEGLTRTLEAAVHAVSNVD